MKRAFDIFRNKVAADLEGAGNTHDRRYHRWLTFPLSKLFAWGVFCRNLLFNLGIKRQKKLPGTTISIGNIVMGGTGKSPIVIETVKYLESKGALCGIVTRGYGSSLKASDSLVLLDGKLFLPADTKATIPDEALMQSIALPGVPVIVGPQRWDAVRRFLMAGKLPQPTHWVLDDGFQHRSMTRDLDIVLLDFASPFGNHHLIPRGNLRESPHALRRADLVIFTRCSDFSSMDAPARIIERYFDGPHLAAAFRPSIRLESINQSGVFFDARSYGPVLAVCGIARPQRFLDDIKIQGINVGETYFVGDHEPIDPVILNAKSQRVASVITTAKDFYRDPKLFNQLTIPVFLQELSIVFSNAGLNQALDQLLVNPYERMNFSS